MSQESNDSISIIRFEIIQFLEVRRLTDFRKNIAGRATTAK
jgi:hypothetical protein